MVSAFEAVGQHSAGKIGDKELLEVERHACPGIGSCGGMFTANTMSSIFEAMGMSLPYSSTMAAEDAREGRERRRVRAGARRRDQDARCCPGRSSPARRSKTVSPCAWRSAARPTPCCTCWPSRTRPRCPLVLDDFETIRAKVPVLCDLKPSGRYVATDLHRAGGVPQVMKMLLAHGLLHGDALSITGQDHRRSVEGCPRRAAR